MFRKKVEGPRADIDRYVPKLKEYLRIHYVKPEPQKRYSLRENTEVRYSLPSKPVRPADPEIRYSLAMPEDEDVRAMLNRASRDMSVLESPAVKNYYHSWEKLNSVRKSFSSEVMRMVKEKYPKASSFYRPVEIDKRTFHRLKTDYEYKPSKNTAMRCCIGLHLDGKQAEDLLKLAGYALSPSDPSDLAIRFCLDNGIWDLASINYLLASFDVKDLEGTAPGMV